MSLFMDTLLPVFLIGISFGFILFLLAAGQSLVMGLMRMVNMAHGALFMIGAYAGLAVAQYTHNFLIALVAGAVCTGLIGLFMQTAFLQRLYKQEDSQVLLTIGFVYILTNAAQWIWGAEPLSGIVPAIFSGSIPIGKIYFPVYRFFVIGFGLVMAALLWIFQEKTKIGAIVRAGMDNREIAGTLGINLKVIFTGIFVMGALIAGLCGLIGAPLMGINLGIGWDALRLALIVVVVGGTGSVQGALLGGVIIGLLNAFGTAYFPQYAYFIVYAALILILLLKPSGLMGRVMPVQRKADQTRLTSRSADQDEKGRYAESSIADKPTWPTRLHSIVPYVAVGVILLILPLFLPNFYVSLLTRVLIYAIFAISLDFILGYCGLITLGHAAFMGVAGYTVGILSVHLNLHLFWILVPAAIAVSAIVAAIIGFISLRVSGVYFLLVTMIFGELLANVATKWSSVTGGSDGLVNIKLPNIGIPGFTWTDTNFYYVVFIVFTICFLILYIIVNSSFGQALIGVRENEMRMRCLGYNTWSLKYVAIIISGAIAGFSGIFFAYFYRIMAPNNMALQTSATVLLMGIIGGPGTLFGPFIGAAIIVVIQQISSVYVPDRWPLILGTIFVICVMLVRGGFARYLSAFWKTVKFQRASGGGVPDSVKE